MLARMAMTALTLEAFLVFFAVLAAIPISDHPTHLVVGVGLGMLALCLIAAGLVRRPGGIIIAWVVQVILLASSIAFPTTLLMTPIFVVLFWWLTRVGRRIDRERAEIDATMAEKQPAT